MSDREQKRDESADALRALAGGDDPTPAQAEEAAQRVEGDQTADDADPLASLSGKGSAPGLGAAGTAGDVPDDPAADIEAAAEIALGPASAEAPAEQTPEPDAAEGAEAPAHEAPSMEDAAAAALAAADAGPADLAAELAAHAEDPLDAAVVLAAAAGGGSPAAAAPASGAPAFPGVESSALSPTIEMLAPQPNSALSVFSYRNFACSAKVSSSSSLTVSTG